MKKLLFLALLLMGIAVPSYGACSGSSPNLTAPTWADVALCHTAAVNGDTITVTAGSYTVTATTTITKFVTIIASGTVTLTDNVADVADLITITESTAGHTRLEGFTFVQGSGQHLNPNGVINLVDNSGGLGLLVTRNSYASGTTGDFIIAGVNRGVIWANSITATWIDTPGVRCSNNVAFVRHKNLGLTGVWTEGPYYGTADTNGDKNLYIENNTLDNAFEGVDVDANARTVVRYNTITNSGILNHGVDTGDISGRYMDIYQNTFVWDTTAHCSGGAPASVNSVIYLRGAPALIHDNVIPNVTGMFWGDKSEITFTDEKLRRNAGSYGCWTGGYPSRQQVGWGYSTGGTEAGNTGQFQDLEPVYLWNNTGAGNYNSPSVVDYAPNECGGGAPSSSTYIVEDREYYLDTAKPGYNAYTYPHPYTVTELYSSTTGSDSLGNNCRTIATPCDLSNGMAAEIAQMVAGNRLNLCHSDCATPSSGSFSYLLTPTYGAVPVGTSFTNAITIRGYPGETITWTYSSGDTIFGPLSDIYPTHRNFYWSIEDLIIDGANVINFPVGGLGADFVRFRNVEVRDGVRTGILVGGSDWQFLGTMNVHNNGTVTNQDHGIYIGGGSNHLVDGGEYHDNQGYGIQIYSGVFTISNVIIRNARIYSNNPDASGAAGIILTSGSNNQAYNNLIYNNREYCIHISTSQNSTANAVYNNTCYANEYGIYIGPGATGAIVRNNILFGTTIGTNTVDNDGSSSVINTNLLDANPLFTDAAMGDFTLLAASPAIDAGVSLSATFTTDKNGVTRPQAAGWDIGAYERIPGVGGPGSGNTRDAPTITENCTGSSDPLTTGYTQHSTVITVNRDGSGRCTGSAASDSAMASVRSTGTFADAQYASATVRSLGTSVLGASYPNVGCLLSADQDGIRDGYHFVAYTVDTTVYTTLIKWTNGAGSEIAQRTDTTWADGDEIAIECAGGHIYGFKNTSVILDILDSTHTTGKPGFGANGDALIDDIELGDLNGGSPTCQINITGPQEDQIVRRPGNLSITWLSSGCTGNFDLEYSFDFGVTYLPIATVAYTATPYSFNLDAQALGASDDFRIRVKQGAVVETEAGIVLKGRYLR